MTPAVAVFAVGNRSRGDDAVGPMLLDRLGAWLEAHGGAREFELFEEYQLQPENALDLADRRLALFVDACRDARDPVTFGAVGAASPHASPSTHALTPAAVLGAYMLVQGEAPPPAFVLAVRATHFELGAGLSAAAHEALEDAWVLLRLLAGCPRHEDWQKMAAIARAPRASPCRPAP